MHGFRGRGGSGCAGTSKAAPDPVGPGAQIVVYEPLARLSDLSISCLPVGTSLANSSYTALLAATKAGLLASFTCMPDVFILPIRSPSSLAASLRISGSTSLAVSARIFCTSAGSRDQLAPAVMYAGV